MYKYKDYIFLILLVFLLIPISSASITIDNPDQIFSTTTANFSFPNNITLDALYFQGSYIILIENGSQILFSANSNTTISYLYNLNDNVNIIINSSGNINIIAQMSKSNTYYVYVINDTSYNILSDDTGLVNINIIIYKQTTFNIYYSTSLFLTSLNTCNSIRNYSDIIFPIFGLALMTLGFGVIILQIRGAENGTPANPYIIITSIIISIVGFATLLIANYIIYKIFGIVC